jgi:hypothetical protein
MVQGATAVANEQKEEIVVENDWESEIADSVVVVLAFELALVVPLHAAIVIVRFVATVAVVEAETAATVVADTEISQTHPFLHRGYIPTNNFVDASSKPEPKMMSRSVDASPVVAWSVESTAHELNDNTDDEGERFASVGSLTEVGADHSLAGDEPAKDDRRA